MPPLLCTRLVAQALRSPHGLIARLAERFPTTFFSWYHVISGTEHHSWNGRRGGVTLSFDCDYSTDTAAIPQLLDLLAPYPFKTAFACIGILVERSPDVYLRIVTDGHEIVNHTYAHPDNREFNPDRRFNELTTDEQETEIHRFHEVSRRLLGYAPTGFRIPHFGRLFDPRIYGELQRLGYVYSSSLLSSRAPGYGSPYQTQEGIWEFPISVCPAHPLATCFDSSHLFRNADSAWGHTEADFLRLFEFMLDVAIRYGTYINLYFDPADIVKVRAFPRALDLLNARADDLWITTYAQWLDARTPS